MKIVFMGTPDFSVPGLQALIDSDCELSAVFTQPDRPVGRGRRVRPSPVKRAAEAAGVPVFEPERPSSSEWVDRLWKLSPDLVITAAYGHILKRPVLDVPRLACINVHASLLPRHRGASPITSAILAGDAQTGVTIIRMSERMDDGNVIARRAIDIAPDDTAGSLHDKLAGLAAEILPETVAAFRRREVVYTIQSHKDATYCAQLSKADGEIDWNASALAVNRHIRAMTPWPGAFTELNSKRLTILKGTPLDCEPTDVPGTVLRADKSGITVAVSTGCILVERLKPAAGKPMSAADFLNGHPVRPGDRFGTAG